ncbi:suppressor of cytokine signaling 2-like [Diabrotica undecimpunctata]|uniref:suppressor of cytokine signaling 2-like n=1 Tax=Diabrotica undecimpunctata TaxID=50387 RepID=UPI003B639454
MLGCNTACPNCKHEFQCCPPKQQCCSTRRSLHVLSGGGLVTTLAPTTAQSPCPSPQVSPSVPLAFILPPLDTPFQSAPAPVENNSETELQRLSDTVRALRLSGWYHEGITYPQSHELLKGTSVGRFLVRNSSDPKFLFSLSVQTERGPTSVRLFYTNGYFRLDAQPHLQSAMPMFPSVIDLIHHYVLQSKLCRSNAQVWVDQQGKWYSPILLDKPLRKRSEPSSLKHLARLAIHKGLQDSPKPRLAMLPSPHTRLELPNSLIGYLSEYPFSI